MKSHGVVVCFVLFIYKAFATTTGHDQNSHDLYKTLFDLVRDGLNDDDWSLEQTQCQKDLLMIIDGVKNSTVAASWMWDSLQLPVGFLYGTRYQLGNYDECLKAPWTEKNPEYNTKYCLADVQISNEPLQEPDGSSDPLLSTEAYFKTISRYKREFQTMTWGVCVPRSCSADSVSKFLRILLRHSILHNVSPNIKIDHCEESVRKTQFSQGFKTFWYTMLFLGVVALCSTWYYNRCDGSSRADLLAKLSKAFSINDNAASLASSRADDLSVMHGVRVFLVCLLVLAHFTLYINYGAVVNGLAVEQFADEYWFFLHVDILVDAFFFMSALLATRSLVAKRNNPGNQLRFLFLRYVRLIPLLVVVVWFIACVFEYTGDGPLWRRFASIEGSLCRQNWHKNLMLVNNYGVTKICHQVTWYAAADYQLTIPAVVVFHLWLRNRRLGAAAILVLAVVGVAVPTWAAYAHNIPGTMIIDMKNLQNPRDDVIFGDAYSKPHHRVGSYLVGMAAGYLLAMYDPAQVKNKLSKTWTLLLQIVSFVSCFTIVAVGGLFSVRPYSTLESVTFAASNRILWSLLVGVLIFSTEYGVKTPISNYFCWKAWVPLSKLSYGVYLTHTVFMQYVIYSSRTPLTVHPSTILLSTFGFIVASYLTSFALWLLVHAPVSNLVNLVFPSSKKNVMKSQTNGVENNNKTKVLDQNLAVKTKNL